MGVLISVIFRLVKPEVMEAWKIAENPQPRADMEIGHRPGGINVTKAFDV